MADQEKTVSVPVSTIKRIASLVSIIQGYGHFYPGQDGYQAMAEIRETADKLTGALPKLGYCPHCGAAGVQREKRPNGNDTCENGHVYPSRAAR